MINGMYGFVIECIVSGNCSLYTAQLTNGHSLRHHFFCRQTLAQVKTI